MFDRLLVAIDFGPSSDAALEYARISARAFGAVLHVMHILPNVFLRPVVGDPRSLEDATHAQLRDRFTSADQRRLGLVTAVERSDEPAEEIVSYARIHEINLIVIGTHGRSGVAHWVMGSVAEKVVRAAPCPVLTVRTTLPQGVTGFERILVPSGLSTPPQGALECARLIGERFGASVHPLRVPADPAHSIVRHAADNGFDLIVMGTHGRTGIAHVVKGSVAEDVIRTATCPVLTVHMAHEKTTGRLSEREPVGFTD